MGVRRGPPTTVRLPQGKVHALHGITYGTRHGEQR
jgi:hypothetical protein